MANSAEPSALGSTATDAPALILADTAVVGDAVPQVRGVYGSDTGLNAAAAYSRE